MVKIDIISGFLGAGKTTLIKKLLKDGFQGEQVVLIENEFGEIGIDGGFLKEAGIQIREMNSGCICCSLVGDFGTSLKEVVTKYDPDRILIEPSGVGKLSDVIKAVQGVQDEVDIKLNSYTTVVDAKKCKMYMKNFGEFFDNQIQYAGAIIMSRTDIRTVFAHPGRYVRHLLQPPPPAGAHRLCGPGDGRHEQRALSVFLPPCSGWRKAWRLHRCFAEPDGLPPHQ